MPPEPKRYDPFFVFILGAIGVTMVAIIIGTFVDILYH